MTHRNRDRLRRRRQMLEDCRLGLPALPRIVEQPGADRREWTAEYAGTLDDFIADAITRGAPPPVPTVYRGVQGVMLGEVLAIPWGDGVLAGAPDAVARRIDSRED